MLDSGVAVKNVSFRRDGFPKWENMNRKKTKNLLVLMVLSSAAAAGYLVFYNHEPGERGLVDDMHIDGAIDSGVHRHRVDDDDDAAIARNKHGKMIGDKLFLHGVNKADIGKESKVKSLAERLKEKLAERKREKEKEEEIGDVGMGKGAINLEEQEEEEPVKEEKKAENIESLRERLKLRLQQRKKLMNEANAEAEGEAEGEKEEVEEDKKEVVDKKVEEDWGVADKEEKEGEAAEEEVEKVVTKSAKVQSLMERLRARLAEQKKEKESQGEEIEVKVTKSVVKEDDDPFGPGADEPAAKAKPVESEADDPFGPGDSDSGESLAKVVTYKPKKSGMRNIADIIYEKKYGVKRPQIKEEVDDLIEPFDDRAFNRKPKNDDDDGGIVPVQRPVVDLDRDDDKAERVRQHINELNQMGDNEDAMPKRDHGMDAFARKEVKNPFLRKKRPGFGGFDSGQKFDSGNKFANNPFMKKKFSAFDAVKKAKNINDPNAFNERGRQRVDDDGPVVQKNDAFGAFRGGGREFGDESNIGLQARPPARIPEKKENQFINAKGLLKGGGGNPVIRPFGNNGMNPFMDKGFDGVKAVKNKAPIFADEEGPKVHFDFRNLDKKNKKPGLLIEDDDGDSRQLPQVRQGLPPRGEESPLGNGEVPVDAPNKFGLHAGHAHANGLAEVPVPPPKKIAAQNQLVDGNIAHINALGQAPVMHPDQLKQRQNEVPVAPPRRIIENKDVPPLLVHDVFKESTYSATCKRYIYPAPVGAGQICVHKTNQDLVSDTINNEGSWEHQMVTEMVNILNSDWHLGLVDIGAGIGVFSLCAAMLHRTVVSVEPFYANYMALHKGAYVNGKVGDKITLITQALDNATYTGRMALGSNDGGYSNIHISKPEPGVVVEKKRAVAVTTLDDLNDQCDVEKVNFATKNVIKLDVTDNKEARILMGGKQFLKDRNVVYIMTHWRKSRAESDHIKLMTTMATLGFQPKLTYDGDVIEMSHLNMDQAYIVWSRAAVLPGL